MHVGKHLDAAVLALYDLPGNIGKAFDAALAPFLTIFDKKKSAENKENKDRDNKTARMSSDQKNFMTAGGSYEEASKYSRQNEADRQAAKGYNLISNLNTSDKMFSDKQEQAIRAFQESDRLSGKQVRTDEQIRNEIKTYTDIGGGQHKAKLASENRLKEIEKRQSETNAKVTASGGTVVTEKDMPTYGGYGSKEKSSAPNSAADVSFGKTINNHGTKSDTTGNTYPNRIVQGAGPMSGYSFTNEEETKGINNKFDELAKRLRPQGDITGEDLRKLVTHESGGYPFIKTGDSISKGTSDVREKKTTAHPIWDGESGGYRASSAIGIGQFTAGAMVGDYGMAVDPKVKAAAEHAYKYSDATGYYKAFREAYPTVESQIPLLEAHWKSKGVLAKVKDAKTAEKAFEILCASHFAGGGSIDKNGELQSTYKDGKVQTKLSDIIEYIAKVKATKSVSHYGKSSNSEGYAASLEAYTPPLVPDVNSHGEGDPFDDFFGAEIKAGHEDSGHEEESEPPSEPPEEVPIIKNVLPSIDETTTFHKDGAEGIRRLEVRDEGEYAKDHYGNLIPDPDGPGFLKKSKAGSDLPNIADEAALLQSKAEGQSGISGGSYGAQGSAPQGGIAVFAPSPTTCYYNTYNIHEIKAPDAF